MRKLDIPSMTATQLTRKYGQGNLSPVEVIEVVFDRIKALNPKLNAFHFMFEDNAVKAAQK